MTSSVTPLEQKITDVLTTVLEPTKLEVVDTSGGCGAMYKIRVESQLFHVCVNLILNFPAFYCLFR